MTNVAESLDFFGTLTLGHRTYSESYCKLGVVSMVALNMFFHNDKFKKI